PRLARRRGRGRGRRRALGRVEERGEDRVLRARGGDGAVGRDLRERRDLEGEAALEAGDARLGELRREEAHVPLRAAQLDRGRHRARRLISRGSTWKSSR